MDCELRAGGNSGKRAYPAKTWVQICSLVSAGFTMNQDPEGNPRLQNETGPSRSPSASRSPDPGGSPGIRLGQAGGVPQYKKGNLIAGRYKVLSVLGRGAIGTVYSVEQVFLKKRFALKTLSSSVASSVWQQRLQKEAQAASRLDHPNLVKAVDFGVDDDRFFFVMDFVAGRTLSRHLKEAGRLSVEEALKIFIPICFAFDYAHNQGVIHRDIKPSNIVLERAKGEAGFVPKIIDFGIAKIAEEVETEALTKTGEVFGTPWYMSPEQCSGVSVDHRSDIYSLGCVLYETLTGAAPFCAPSALQTMMQHRTEPVVPLTEASAGLQFPADLESIVMKMLAKNPDDRYQRCINLAEDLMHLQRGEAVAATSQIIPSANPRDAASRRQPRRYLFLSLIPVIASIAMLVYTYRPQPKPPEAAVSLVAAVRPANSGASAPKDYDQGEFKAYFCRRDQKNVRTFEFGERATDPTFTFGSAIRTSFNEMPHSAKGVFSALPEAYVEFQPTMTLTLQHPTSFLLFKPGDIQVLSFHVYEFVDVEPVRFNFAMAYVGGMKDLHVLKFSHVPLNADGLANLKLDNMRSLTNLDLIDTAVDGSDLGNIAKLRKLRSLQFSYGKNTMGLLHKLKGLWHSAGSGVTAKTRHELWLRSDKLTDDDLSAVSECDPAVLILSDNPGLTNAGLRHLFKRTRLETLGLDGNQFDPAVLAELAAKSHLAHLIIRKVDWTNEQEQQFCSRLPDCEVEFPKDD